MSWGVCGKNSAVVVWVLLFFFFFCKSERLYGSVIQGLRKKYELYELMLKYCFAGDKQLVQTNGFGTVAAFQRL